VHSHVYRSVWPDQIAVPLHVSAASARAHVTTPAHPKSMSLCPCCHRGTSGPGVTRTGLEAPLAPARDRGTQGGGCRSSSTPGLHSSAVVLLQAASCDPLGSSRTALADCCCTGVLVSQPHRPSAAVLHAEQHLIAVETLRRLTVQPVLWLCNVCPWYVWGCVKGRQSQFMLHTPLPWPRQM
jgi:hypothetical protein